MLAGLAAALLPAVPAGAQTLEQALVQSYTTNTTLDTQRAQLRVTDEAVPQALSGFRPTAQATGSLGAAHVSGETQSGQSFAKGLTPRSAQAQVDQPLYRGGATTAAVRAAEAQVLAQRATLFATEESVLLSAATAYLDVVLAQAELDLNINNEQVLRRQLQSTQDQFRVGTLTRTDVSQAESALSNAIALRILAESNLNSARATYARVVGSQPSRLTYPNPKLPLPASLNEAVELARSKNPNVLSAQYAETVSREQVTQAKGSLLPSADLTGTVSTANDVTTQIFAQSSATVAAQVTVPLYTAGSVASRVRQAQQTVSVNHFQAEDQRRQVTQSTVAAWESLNAARATIISRQEAVRASGIALQGVRQEQAVGTRTVTEVLNQEQDLLNQQTALVQAQHDALVAAFQLLSATGQLTAQELKLPVKYYDYERYYKEVRNKWLGINADSGR
jgi:outer membrane protein/adhesin transport system outer membrane protein